MNPREIAFQIESEALLPAGDGDRFGGYAVIGLPFRSGHVLALRRFPASSVGPGYTSVWHRDPQGVWTFYSTVDPGLGCSRYFGAEITRNVVAPIGIEWTGPTQFQVNIDGAIHWELSLRENLPLRFMNSMASLVPDTWWHKKFMLRAIGVAARFTLGAGKLNLAGRTPNGQEFITNPVRVWLIDSSRATVNGTDPGQVGALSRQAQLNDFLIPQRGLFAVARAFLQQGARETLFLQA
jgi:hypothetical protein